VTARVLLACVLAAMLVGGHAAQAKPAAKPKVRCHWIKATKKKPRHRVCVKVKATKKAPARKPAAPKPAPKPAAAPVATGAPAPAPAAAPAPDAPALSPPAVVTTPAAPAIDPALPAPPAAARVQATAREFSLVLSRTTITAGAATIELVNRGEDPHDLHVRPAAGGADVLAIPRVDPGAVDGAAVTLAAGAYTLYCALPGHEALGMKAALTAG
jgi:plastocyanin